MQTATKVIVYTSGKERTNKFSLLNKNDKIKIGINKWSRIFYMREKKKDRGFSWNFIL